MGRPVCSVGGLACTLTAPVRAGVLQLQVRLISQVFDTRELLCTIDPDDVRYSIKMAAIINSYSFPWPVSFP